MDSAISKISPEKQTNKEKKIKNHKRMFAIFYQFYGKLQGYCLWYIITINYNKNKIFKSVYP